MKGLLRKDLYMAVKSCRLQFVVILIFAVCFIQSESIFLLFYPIVMAGIIPINLIAYDEKSRWDVYARVFPYSVKDLVSVKYVVTLLFLGISMVVILIAQGIGMWKSRTVHWQSVGMMAAALATTGLFSPCIMLPAVFKVGVEKGRVIYYAVLIGTFALLGAAGVWGSYAGIVEILSSLGGWLVPVLLAADVLLLAVSWWLSVRFYQAREI